MLTRTKKSIAAKMNNHQQHSEHIINNNNNAKKIRKKKRVAPNNGSEPINLLETYSQKLLQAKAKLQNLEKKELRLQQTLKEQESEYIRTMKLDQSDDMEVTKSSVGSEDEEYVSPSKSTIVHVIREENTHLLDDIKMYINDLLKHQNTNVDKIKSKESFGSTNILIDNRTSFPELLTNRRSNVTSARGMKKMEYASYLPSIHHHEKPLNSHSEWIPVLGT
jgi:molecular chaperone GrpE (heat shock protein)